MIQYPLPRHSIPQCNSCCLASSNNWNSVIALLTDQGAGVPCPACAAREQVSLEALKALENSSMPSTAFAVTREAPPRASKTASSCCCTLCCSECITAASELKITRKSKDSLILRKQFSRDNIKHLGFVKQEAAHICQQISDNLHKQLYLMRNNIDT